MKCKFLPNSILTTGIYRNMISTFAVFVMFFCLQPVSAQTLATIGTASSTSSLSGLSSTTTSGDRNERHACIYSATELTTAGLVNGSTLLSIAWEKTGTASYTGNNLTIRVWLKHATSTTFAANPTFNTETTGATLVYQTTTGTIPDATGWLTFPFNMATFSWNGTDHLEVITELIRPTSWTTTGFSWRTISSVTNAAANATAVSASPPATLTRTGTRPQVRFEVAANGNDAALVSMPSPVSAAPGVQNINVVLRNTGTTTLTTADIGWTINGGTSTNFAWSGNLTPGNSTTVTIASPNFTAGSYTIQATVSNPNGGADQGPANNVVTKNIIVCAPLTGAYFINKGQPTAGNNFNNFNDFSTYLTNCGVSGNVTATVVAASGPYNEQVVFSNIPGLGAAATVTIEGNGQTIVSDTAILSTGSNPNRHIIRLTDLQYFTINNLRVNMVAGSTAFIGIHIFNTGNHITVSNCVVDMGTGTSTLLGAIAATGSESSLLSGGDFNNINITGNTSTAGGYGAVCYGNAPAGSFSNVISGNNFTGTTSNGIYVQQNNNILITGNTINFNATTGIQLAGAGNINSQVEKNFISCNNPTNTQTFRGIQVFGSSPASPNKVVNNVIRNMNAPQATMIGLSNRTTGAEFYFNTVILDNAGSTGNTTFGFEEELSNTASLLRNNIFYISRNSGNYGAALALASTSTVTTALNSDHNTFFTANGAHVAVRKGSLTSNPPNNIYANLNDWQTASGEDANSFQTDPLFQVGTAIPQSGVINGQGVTIAGITTDILNVTRTSPPDPGAYEFSPPSGDAAMTDFILPAIPHCASTLDVNFELTNAGGNTLTSVTINWTVNGVPQTPVNWTGSLASGNSTIVTLGNIPVANATLYTFSATSSNPNGGVDVNTANDNFTYTGFRKGYAGALTINGAAPASFTNYQTFQSLANALSQYGVCGAVNITVLNGSYIEQVVFNTIPGTSPVNTVTLNGNNQILEYNPTLATSDHILQLNAVTHMIVENLRVTSLHPTQGRGIHITNGASKLVIRNNIVNVSITNTMSTTFGIIISGANWLLDGSLSDSVIISGNTVSGGYSSIQLSGVHWNSPLTRISVLNNTVLDWYGFGIYLSYTNGCRVSKNIIRRPFRSNSGADAVTPAGITVPAGSLSFLLEKNRIYDLHLGMPGSSTISRGFYVSGTTTAPTSGTIQNNLVYGMNNDGAQYGIQDNSVTGPINIYHNTIVLNNATGATSSNTNAINLSNTQQQNGLDIRNNIFVVTRGGTGVKRIFDVASSSAPFISNYNVAYLNTSGGSPSFGQIGSTTYNTLVDWQTTGKDLNTVSADPQFTSPGTGNFTPTNFAVDGSVMGTSPVGGITDDILDVIRSANPDAGAFEFLTNPCTTASGGTASTSSGPLCGPGSGTITATGYTTGLGISYQWQYSSDNFVTDINDLVGQTNPASASTGTITATTYYRLRVTCSTGPTTAFSNIVTITVTTPPSATISYAGSPYCANAGTASVTRTGTAGGTYSSTAGLTINAATGDVTLGTSTPGTYTVTYTIPAAGGCPLYTATTAITITAAPAANISYAGSPYCSNAGTATVTHTGTTGGTYSSTAGLTIDPATGAVNLGTSTPGTYTVTYTVAASGGCALFTTTTSITIAAAPNATIAYTGTPYCTISGTASVTRTGTAGGTYSSTAGLTLNPTTGTVTLGTSTPGTYTVTYTIAAAGPCAAFTTTTNITIINCAIPCQESFDGVTPPAFPPGWFATTGAGSCGASTPWVTTNTASSSAPNAAFTNDPACVSDEYLDTRPYNVLPTGNSRLYFRNNFELENGFDGMVLEMSVNAGPYTDIIAAGGSFVTGGYTNAISAATGSPIAGRQAWTGNSGGFITSSVNLPASANGQSVVFRFRRATDISVASTGVYIDDVYVIQTATINYAGSPYCSNGGTANVTQTGQSGGTYTSTAGLTLNATTGAVTLGTSTPGTYTVTYTTSSAGCPAFTTTATITITAAPSATISYAGSPYCSTDLTAPVTRTGTAGGTYSAAPAGLTINATTGTVTPNTSTPGTYTVTYAIPAGGGCAAYSTTTSITITQAPNATIMYTGTPYCQNGGTATITRSGTAGGTYTATPAGLTINAATGAVTLATSTPGTYTVTYTMTAPGCGTTITQTTITITATPAATISYAGSPYCSNAGTANVTRTGTAGGTYSSTAGLTINATTGAVTPGTSTPGTYTVTYTIPASGGCATFTTTTIISITALPAATISYAGSPYCSNAGTATVTRTGTAGGTYSATPAGLVINATTGDVNLATSTAGTYTVTYTMAAGGGCPAVTATTTITINTLPAATISYAGNPYCQNAGTATVTRTGTAGGTYSATPAGLTINAATGAVTLGTSTPGTYTVSYTIAASGGCAAVTATTSLTVSSLSVAATAANASSTSVCGPTAVTLSVTGGSLGTGATWRWYSASCGGTLVGTGATLNVTVSATTTYFVRAEGTCNTTTCASVTVTVNVQPTITLTATSPTSLMPGQTSTLTATVTPANPTNTTTWYRNGNPIGVTGLSLVVGVNELGLYSVRTTTTAGCTALSNSVLIKDSINNRLFITPNPNNGQFQVRYYTSAQQLGFVRHLVMFAENGQKVFDQTYPITAPYSSMNIDARHLGKGFYMVMLTDAFGNEVLATGKVIIQ